MNLDCILCFYYEVNNNLQVSFIILSNKLCDPYLQYRQEAQKAFLSDL